MPLVMTPIPPSSPNANRAKLSPENRKRFLHLSRERKRLIREYSRMAQRMVMGNASQETRNKFNKINEDLGQVLGELHRDFPYERGVIIENEREAELLSRKNKGSEALKHIANQRFRKGYYSAERMLGKLQQKWNLEYGPRNEQGRRSMHGPMLEKLGNNVRLLNSMRVRPVANQVIRGRSASPRAQSVSRPKRARSAPVLATRGGHHHPSVEQRRQNAATRRIHGPHGGLHFARTWARNMTGRIFIRKT